MLKGRRLLAVLLHEKTGGAPVRTGSPPPAEETEHGTTAEDPFALTASAHHPLQRLPANSQSDLLSSYTSQIRYFCVLYERTTHEHTQYIKVLDHI